MKKVLLIVPFAFILLLNACSSPSGSPQTVRIDASWAEYYSSLKELRQHSDLAVQGTISVVAPSIKSNLYVSTMVTVKVEHVLWNPKQKTAPAAVAVKQVGGIYKGVKYVVEDDPLFSVGEHVILFLQEYSPGTYKISGGPSGRFRIQNNIVYPIVSDGVQLPDKPEPSRFALKLENA